MDGKIERGISWALQFVSGKSKAGWRLERGSMRSGQAQARLPAEPGLEIGGRFASLRFEDWFPGRGGGGGDTAGGDLIRQIDLEAGTLCHRRSAVPRRADRGQACWPANGRSPSADPLRSGAIVVPVGPGSEAPILLDMERLWLLESDPATGDGRADPRNLPAIRASVGDFALNEMRLGQLTADHCPAW